MAVGDDAPAIGIDDTDDDADRLLLLVDPVGQDLLNFCVGGSGKRTCVSVGAKRHEDDPVQKAVPHER